jgi:single-strand DNA-binding protein
MNQVALIGRLCADPMLKYIPHSGTAVATFTIAVDKGLSKDKRQEMESKNQPTADFIRVIAWNKQAENCANFLVKGRLVGISGRIQSGSFDDKDGKRVFTTDVVAQQVSFLEWGDKNESSSNMNEYDMDGFQPSEEDIPF